MGLFKWLQDQGPKTATTTHARTGSPKGGGSKQFSSMTEIDSWTGKPKVVFRTAEGKRLPDPRPAPAPRKPQGSSWNARKK